MSYIYNKWNSQKYMPTFGIKARAMQSSQISFNFFPLSSCFLWPHSGMVGERHGGWMAWWVNFWEAWLLSKESICQLHGHDILHWYVFESTGISVIQSESDQVAAAEWPCTRFPLQITDVATVKRLNKLLPSFMTLFLIQWGWADGNTGIMLLIHHVDP